MRRGCGAGSGRWRRLWHRGAERSRGREWGSGWQGEDGFCFVDAVFKGGVKCASAVDGETSNIILSKNGGFSSRFLDAHLATEPECTALWIEFAGQGGHSAVGLDLADGAAIGKIEIAAGVYREASGPIQAGFCAFGVKVVAYCDIANKSGSRAILLDFADDEVVGVHDIYDPGIVHSNAAGAIEAGCSACSVHIAFRFIPTELSSKRGNLTSGRDFSDGVKVAEVEVSVFIGRNGRNLGKLSIHPQAIFGILVGPWKTTRQVGQLTASGEF